MAAGDETEPGFEDALGHLERIVAALERGDTELSEALTQYERGVRLLARCHHLLDSAEQTVAILTNVDAAGNPQTTTFDATATTERERPAAPSAPRARRSAAARTSDDEGNDIPF
ncbi:MAG: exodeoxyribonuclease VII small subunit [Isosphaeraceae bacterium]|nr:exodeoxyribonuclease VII small subunit [Isosphaeraceae bacterium]